MRVLPTDGLAYHEQKNLGARHTDSDIVMFLDSDVIPEDGWLASLLQSFEDGAFAAMAVAFRLWRVAPGHGTVLRSLLLCVLAFTAPTAWPTPGALVLVKILAISSAVPLAFWVLGGFDSADTARFRSLVRPQGA